MIPLSIPNLAGNEWEYVQDCLSTGWVSSAGAYVNKFESAIASLTSSKHAIACMNGTAALHISQILCGVTADDLVIVPNVTFIATLNSVKYTGADPVLIDVDPDTWQIDINLLETFLANQCVIRDDGTYHQVTNRRIAAVMPVHVLGNMCDMPRLMEVCGQYGLDVIEDSTEALGSTYRGQHAGTFGRFGTSSFNGNKIVTSGGGGMIMTQHESLAARAKHLTTTAKTDELMYIHDEVGYNYRLVNVLAAIGLAQVEQFGKILARKKDIDKFYREQLAQVGDIEFQKVEDGVDPNCWLFTFRTRKRDELMQYLLQNGIQCRPLWTPMNQLHMFRDALYVNETDYSSLIQRETISIPSSSSISDQELDEVVIALRKFYAPR